MTQSVRIYHFHPNFDLLDSYLFLHFHNGCCTTNRTRDTSGKHASCPRGEGGTMRLTLPYEATFDERLVGTIRRICVTEEAA